MQTARKRALAVEQRGVPHAKEAWGLFLSTDSPTMKALALAHAELGGRDRLVASNGTFGHVTIPSATCESEGQKCARSDPREAWAKSMVDLVVLSMCDKILVMFESSYNNAALARSFREGRTTYYEHRITHRYTDGVLTQYKGSNGRAMGQEFAEIWDLFGPLPHLQ